MSQSGSQQEAKAKSLLDALFDEAHTTAASEIREDIAADGGNPEQIAADLRTMALDLVAQSRKSRLIHAKGQLQQSVSRNVSALRRDASRIRQRLRELVSRNESLGNGRVALAFRNGVTQSDNDLLSLWQDLVELGAVSDDDLRD
jgi:hypothetical protein